MVSKSVSLTALKTLAKQAPEKALSELQTLVKAYPYFQAVRVLELDLLRELNHKGYKKALRLCALQTSFRNALYEHLENHKISTQNIPKIPNQPAEENSFLAWLEWVNSNTSEKNPQTLDWIDDFLENRPSKITPSATQKNKDLTKDQTLATNEIMTETLAKLYWKQKKYEEAKNAFKVLALKYPEKSGFFADQIKLIEAETASK